MNLILADGRRRFYQWDTDLYLIVDGIPIGGELHYDMPDVTDPVSYKIHDKDGQTVCKVPDKLLQHAGKFTVWAYIRDELGNRTVYKKSFNVEAREKPSDYIATEEELRTWVELNERLNKLQEEVDDFENIENTLKTIVQHDEENRDLLNNIQDRLNGLVDYEEVLF